MKPHDQRTAAEHIAMIMVGSPIAQQLATHILQTVRVDDDKQFDVENAWSLLPKDITIESLNFKIRIFNALNLNAFHLEVPTPVSMGQFRKLCDGAGIKLSEET